MTPARTALTLAAVGAAVAVRRRRPVLSSYDEALPVLRPRVRQLPVAGGVLLHVEEHGPADAGATLVLAHGYVQSCRVWDRQVAALLTARPDLRVLSYDHRGHGRSGRSPAELAELGQLGRDLAAVLDTLPEGPVVLAGHSMGGMTVMAFAEQHPELIGPRVVGVALVGTSPGRLAEVTYGLPRAVARGAQALLPRSNELARRRESAGKRALPNRWMSRLIFGKGARPADVRMTMDVMARCSAATVADFHATFGEHDRLAALAALSDVPVTVLVGSRDLLCPVSHSEAIAQALPHSTLLVYPGAGHMVQLERAAEVSRRLVELCEALPRPEGRRRTQATAS